MQATLSCLLVFAVPPLWVLSSDFVTVHLVFQPQVPDDSTEMTAVWSQTAAPALWSLMVIPPDESSLMVITTICLMAMGIICFLMSPVTHSESVLVCLGWDSALCCTEDLYNALWIFFIFFSVHFWKKWTCVSKNWRGPVFHFLSPCQSKNFPNNCLLNIPNCFLSSALA